MLTHLISRVLPSILQYCYGTDSMDTMYHGFNSYLCVLLNLNSHTTGWHTHPNYYTYRMYSVYVITIVYITYVICHISF